MRARSQTKVRSSKTSKHRGSSTPLTP